MSEEKILISSLAMDLKRVALSYHRGSKNTAERFSSEAEKRIEELDLKEVKPYIARALKDVKVLLKGKKDDIAEDMLMYSTILLNYVISSQN